MKRRKINYEVRSPQSLKVASQLTILLHEKKLSTSRNALNLELFTNKRYAEFMTTVSSLLVKALSFTKRKLVRGRK